MSRSLPIAALIAALLLAARPAGAYCRSSVCVGPDGEGQGKVCTPPEPDDCGVELQWRQPCVGFSVQKDASAKIDVATAAEVLRASFAAWTGVSCGETALGISVEDLGTVECNELEYNQHDGNANVLMFRDESWPHEGSVLGGTTETIALTTVTYDVESGDIYDADIEVNTAQFVFTLSDPTDETDLLSVMTHEAGHFLGLAHSNAPDATMWPDYIQGTTDLRSLEGDDVFGICAVYPADRAVEGECTALPRHGFSPYCRAEQKEGKCSLSPGPSPAPRWSGIAAAIAVIAALRRARRRAGRRAR